LFPFVYRHVRVFSLPESPDFAGNLLKALRRIEMIFVGNLIKYSISPARRMIKTSACRRRPTHALDPIGEVAVLFSRE
jgi:hypothetical protein